ncbi:hypothetical protein [Actinoallomurus rhizosphaericola]|uniref:hypothetical protein n=1 Tax=Actinoallomurus rhizosphaericola TaxID=2952536 RepID=UPI002093B781|nr:hypothetical protein [Actinoallomurus rhizosphaericola]MCO5996345.1 hypothetical protein [Actinoallomurus rhizosphaericola]
MIDDRIAALADGEAVTVLRLVLERQGVPVDSASLRRTEQHLAEAVTGAEGLAEPDPDATPGALARTALAHLAGGDEATRELVERAIAVQAGSRERFDPATLGVGALVLLAFRTDVRLERDPEKGWTFKLHTKRLGDSSVGKLLSQLFGVYLKR